MLTHEHPGLWWKAVFLVGEWAALTLWPLSFPLSFPFLPFPCVSPSPPPPPPIPPFLPFLLPPLLVGSGVIFLSHSSQLILRNPCSWHIAIKPSGSCICAKSLQACLTLQEPMDCSPPGSSVHGILQARILEWVAMPFSRGSSRPRDHR